MNLEGVINNISENASKNIPLEEGDYIGDNGLYYCHKCNTPKQTRVQFFFGERVVPCLCHCRAEELKAEEAERKRKAFENKIKEYRRVGFPESDMQDWTFENDDKSNEYISAIAKNYVDNFEKMREGGKGLLFFGSVGTGKTYFAACIANALIDKGYPVLMTNFARIANTAQGLFEGRQEYFDSFNKFPLLILDDLAAERKSEYMQEIVFSVIDARYRVGLPTIITTNLTSQELQCPTDYAYKRIFSRIYDMCIPIEVKGADRRRSNLNKEFTAYADILGISKK